MQEEKTIFSKVIQDLLEYYNYILVGITTVITILLINKKLSISNTYEVLKNITIQNDINFVFVLFFLFILSIIGFLTIVSIKLSTYSFSFFLDKTITVLKRIKLAKKQENKEKDLIKDYYNKLPKTDLIEEYDIRNSTFDYEFNFLVNFFKIYHYSEYREIVKVIKITDRTMIFFSHSLILCIYYFTGDIFSPIPLLFMWILIVLFDKFLFNLQKSRLIRSIDLIEKNKIISADK